MFLSRQKRQTLAGSTLQTNATGSRQQTGTLTGEGARLLRQNRTPAYMDALGKLDAGDARLDPEFAARVVARIRKEFPAVQCLGSFLGILAPCHIDDTYDVHTLDWKEDILQHYHRGEALPEGLAKGRSLALYGGYAFVEVYTDCCRGVYPDGHVAVIPD
ncbi:hypothetical protein [Acidaminococcus timonensis]|uniref:hypothetical protein n=1 Tax=Acidaminococcus timonensis TaxID=1871002 RepID=UPI0008D9080F|nr:hypothetical protein [Acidaminococcus timonensis]